MILALLLQAFLVVDGGDQPKFDFPAPTSFDPMQDCHYRGDCPGHSYQKVGRSTCQIEYGDGRPALSVDCPSQGDGDDCNVSYCVGDLCILTAIHCPAPPNGGDVGKRAIPTPPADCLSAWVEVQESRRLIRNTAVTGGLVTFAAMLDVGSTAWFDHRYACRDSAPGQLCLVEWNSLTPTSLGLVAAKVGVVILATGVSWLADKSGHRTWATIARWLGVAAGVIPAAWNIHKGLQVEQARAAP